MYEKLSEVYEILNADAQYDKRYDYLKELFKKFDRMPKLLLDLACGTGCFSRRFAKDGVSVIAADSSPEMLSIAASKESKNILYICQKAQELELYGTVDGAICCLDSLNHITDYGDFCTALKRVSMFLEEDRLFIFDVNTPFKHRVVLGSNTIVKEEENAMCVWQNELSDDERTVNIYLDIFKEEENGLYSRSFDFITERAYTESEIEKALSDANLKTLEIFGEFTFEAPSPDCERAVYITKKI